MKIRLLLSVAIMVLLMAGCSDDDSPTATDPGTAPDMPAGLTVTDTGLMSVTLSWDTVDDATEYVLYRSNTETGTYQMVYSGAAAGFIDNNVWCAQTYWYEVCAGNSHGESDPCAPVSGTTDTPAGFVVTNSPSGHVDYTYYYHAELNGHPWYQSDPIGVNIIFTSSGTHANNWVFNDQIESVDLYYSVSTADYPPHSGWYTAVGDTRTSTTLTPF
jgi:hypothetical protein